MNYFTLIFVFFVIIMNMNFHGKSFNLYVLKLIQDKFYIGKTTQNVYNRFNQHKIGIGSSWTKLYKPIKILEKFETRDKFEEDKYTKKYMDLYGIDNVRGGSYSNIILTDWQIKAIKRELETSNDLCFKCGKSGHFAYNCNKQKIKKIDFYTK